MVFKIILFCLISDIVLSLMCALLTSPCYRRGFEEFFLDFLRALGFASMFFLATAVVVIAGMLIF